MHIFKINIMGIEYTIRFHKNIKTFKKYTEYIENLNGEFNGFVKEINILMQYFLVKGIKKHLFDHNIRILWHEIGHAIDWEIPNTIEDEYTSSRFEFIPHLIPQVKKIENNLKKLLKNSI